jgi:large subunit ribosomal protein L17
MLRNQAHALLTHGHIETTVPKAKELRPYVERLITIAKRAVVDGSPGKALTARREILRDLPDRDVVTKLFTEIAPRYASRPGGYTRLLRVGYRLGDAAEVAQVELLGYEFDPKAKAAKDEKKADAKPKSVGGRLKAAAGASRRPRIGCAASGRPRRRKARRPSRPRRRARLAPPPARVPARAAARAARRKNGFSDRRIGWAARHAVRPFLRTASAEQIPIPATPPTDLEWP